MTRLGFTPTLKQQYLHLFVSFINSSYKLSFIIIVHTCQLTRLNVSSEILHDLQRAQKAGAQYSKKTLYLQDFWLSLPSLS